MSINTNVKYTDSADLFDVLKRIDRATAVPPMINLSGGKMEERPCLFDQLSDEEKAKPIFLSCPCPKCTVWC